MKIHVQHHDRISDFGYRMSRPRPVTLSPRRIVPANARRRGSVIVLVVAVLALLAVIGTVYIVSARTEKASASAMNANANLDLALQAAMQPALTAIGNSIVGADGFMGSYITSGPYGTQAAHTFDYPDGSEPWLAASLHNVNLPGGVLNNYSRLTPMASPNNVFDPGSGNYDLPLQAFPTSGPYLGALGTVVGDQTQNDNTDDPPTNIADSYMYLLPFSDASGIRYRVGMRILDTNRMANLNVGSTDDSQSNSDRAGSWLTAYRLAPTSGMPANSVYYSSADNPVYLHAAPAPSTLGRSSSLSTQGNAAFSLANWAQQVLRLERPTDLGIMPFEITDELELRSYGEFGTSYHIRAATGNGSTYVCWPNTLSVDANKSAPSSVVMGNPRRRNYTTYSWARALRPYPDPTFKYALNVTDGKGAPGGYTSANGYIWPGSPACVAANPQTAFALGTSPNDMMFYTAMAASNIATLMEYSCAQTNSDNSANTNFTDSSKSYTHEEACAFAANYCTAKWNGFTADPSLPGKNAYFLPAGPSFVDGKGICIRSAQSATIAVHREFGSGAASDLHAESASKIYLGYSAQPFFSEIAVNEINDDTGDGQNPAVPHHTVVAYTAVELYNPYSVALSLNGYHLKSGDGTQDIDLTGQYVPANGYLVITSDNQFDGNGDKGLAIPATAQKVVQNTLAAHPSGDTQYILYRPYFTRGTPPPGTPALAPVDEINYEALTDVNGVPTLPSKQAGDQPKDFSIARPGGSKTGQWGPTVNLSAYTRVAAPNAPTLGDDNGGGGSGFPLTDRYAYPTQGNQGDPFGMGEFARIMRIANEFDGSNNTGALLTTGGSNGGLIPDHLAQLANTTSPYTKMVMTKTGSTTDAIDAQILFDFYGDPHYYPLAGGAPVDPGGNAGLHDVRAVRLLEQIAMIDRVSDFGIDIGGGAVDINKIRIPGQINVNTASGDVLRAIPNMTDKMVANILGYRKRLSASDPSCTYNGQMNDDFNAGTYPGSGIRSIAELLVLLATVTTPTPSTIDQRDLLWGSIANYCTVRSDTFVVYGYLEALKVNPSYNGNHNNGSDWYRTVVDSTTDVNALSTPNLRVARRRWVAIVDRSFCNYSKVHPQFKPDGTPDAVGTPDNRYSLPRIVAIKDLPQ